MSLDREVTGHTSRQDLEKPPPGRPAQAADPVAIGAQCKGPVGAPPPPARRQTLAPWPAKVPEGSTCTARGRKRALQSTAEEGASHAATRAGGAGAARGPIQWPWAARATPSRAAHATQGQFAAQATQGHAAARAHQTRWQPGARRPRGARRGAARRARSALAPTQPPIARRGLPQATRPPRPCAARARESDYYYPGGSP